RRQVLPGRPNPVHDAPRLIGEQERVDQYGVTLPADQRESGGREGRLARAHGRHQPDDRLVRGDEYVEVQWSGHGISFPSDWPIVSWHSPAPCAARERRGCRVIRWLS